MYANVEGHENGQLHIGADDSATIYINGEEIGQTTVDQWVIDHFSPQFWSAAPLLTPV
jgi:hypothetical protein